jgi:hypothetical protein
MTIPNNWNVFCWSRSVRGGELFDSIHLTPGLVPVTSLGPSNWLRNPRSAQNVTLAKNISHIQVLVTNFFPTPPIKLELELQLQAGGRPLIASNPVGANQTIYPIRNRDQSIINTIRLCLLDCCRALKGVVLFRASAEQQSSTGFYWWTSSKIS